MSSRFGLGRGLSALIPGAPMPIATTPSSTTSAVLVVPPERIHPNPHQPRQSFASEELGALVASIREHGVIQPLVVTVRPDGEYELLVGERRLRAAKLAGLATIPVIVRDGTPDDREKLELALIENIQRHDLNPIERATAYERLQEEFMLTQEQIARRLGISRSAVAHAIRLLRLPSDMQEAVRGGVISEGHAKLLASIEDAGEQRAWFDRIREQKLPVAAVAASRAQSPTQSARARQTTSTIDPNLQAKEAALRQRLGARVRITPRGHGGVIAIEYFSAEELAGIVRTITR